MRLTLVQVLINAKGLNMNPMQSLYYVSPACFICLLVPFRECAVLPCLLPVQHRCAKALRAVQALSETWAVTRCQTHDICDVPLGQGSIRGRQQAQALLVWCLLLCERRWGWVWLCVTRCDRLPQLLRVVR